MNFDFAKDLSRKCQIDIKQIVREEYEMFFLKQLFESEFGNNLIFKGGTALRLCYGSPRFSRDLDFSLKEKIEERRFFKVINSFPKLFPQVKIDDLFSKRFTFFALLKIKEEYFDLPFSIKIEISRRKEAWREGKNFQLMLIKSEVIPLTSLGQVAMLKKILEDKFDVLRRRKQPRDLFDIWFVAQKTKEKIDIPFEKFQARELKSELHKFLPRPWQKIIGKWQKEEKLK